MRKYISIQCMTPKCLTPKCLTFLLFCFIIVQKEYFLGKCSQSVPLFQRFFFFKKVGHFGVTHCDSNIFFIKILFIFQPKCVCPNDLIMQDGECIRQQECHQDSLKMQQAKKDLSETVKATTSHNEITVRKFQKRISKFDEKYRKQKMKI